MYQMIYGTGNSGKTQKGRGRLVIMTVVLFFVFCMAVYIYCPEEKMLLQTLLIPGNPEITIQAAEVFASELGGGYALSDALQKFCSTIFENGYTG